MENDNEALMLLKQKVGRRMSEGLSPYGAWLDGTLLAAELGRVEVGFVVRPEMGNPIGLLHGGVTSGWMDEVMGMAVYSLGRPHFFTTVNLVVDYFASARVGQEVVVVGFVEKPGKSILHVRAELWNLERNRLLAKGQSNLLRLDLEMPKP
jgi:uncharacterized protein (TIGR00369 family)